MKHIKNLTKLTLENFTTRQGQDIGFFIANCNLLIAALAGELNIPAWVLV